MGYAIEGWGNPSHVRNVMQNPRENNQNVGKNGRVVSEMITLGLEHDKIWAQWASNVSLEGMLERVWWYRCFEMES
jgi:hypothetical protein